MNPIPFLLAYCNLFVNIDVHNIGYRLFMTSFHRHYALNVSVPLGYFADDVIYQFMGEIKNVFVICE